MNLSTNNLGVVGRGTCGLHLLARIKSHHDKFNKNISFLHFVETTFSSPNYTLSMCTLYQCPILCNPMDYSPPGSSVHGGSPGKNTGVGCHALLQGIFPTQGLNPGLLHCRQILYKQNTREACFINTYSQVAYLHV